MAITSQTTNVEYLHNGSTVDYIINFMYFEQTAIKVYAIDKTTTLAPEPWQNKTAYVIGDLVWTSSNKVFSCVTNHTSSVAPSTIDSDLVNWVIIGEYIGGSWYAQTELAVGSDWSLQTTAGGIALATGVKMPDTVRLSAPAVVPTGHTIRIVRTTAATQTSQPNDKTIEVSLDKLTAQMQEVKANTSSVDDIKVKVDANTASIAALTPRVTATESDISSIAIQQTTQDNRILAVETLKASDADLTALGLRVTANEGDIITAGGLASSAMAKALVNEADIAAIVVDTAQIAVNKANIENLQPRVTALEAADIALQAQITENTGRIYVLEQYVQEATIHGTMDLPNNVSTPAPLTAEYPVGSGTRVQLAYDADETASVMIEFAIDRSTDTTNQPSTGILYMMYRDTEWFIDYGYMYGWNSDIDFTVVTDGNKVGRVFFTSSNFTGANYSGTIRFKATQIGKGV